MPRPEPLAGLRVFDFHTHVYPAGAEGFWRRDSSVEALIAEMDAAGVARAAVIAIAPQITNTVVRDAAARYADRLVVIGSIEPLAADAIGQIDAAIDVSGARAIKLHPRLQGLRLEHLDRASAIAEHCAGRNVPLVICSFQGGRDLYSARTLEFCHELAVRNPQTTLVLAHAGGHRPLDALMILKANPNVCVDLSFSPIYFRGSSVTQDLVYLLEKADSQRVLFGSDFPEAPIADSLSFLADAATHLKLPRARLEAIAFDNAARLLRVDSHP